MIRSGSLLLTLALGLPAAASADAQARQSPQAPKPETLEKKIAAVHRRAEHASPGTAEARSVSRDLAEIGAGYLGLGDTGRAIELLEEAYALDPENGLALAQLTLAYIRSEDFSFARFYLEQAEERAPLAPPEVYAVLGEVYYSLNRLEDAVLAWEQFERLGGGNPSVLTRLARAREELSLSSKQAYREIGEFVFYFDTAISPQTVERLAETLTRASGELSAFLGDRLPGSQVVILYAGRSYFGLVSLPEWISGVFDGKIRVSIDPGGGPSPELQMVLVHELTHAYLRHVSADRAPGWLHEGLAQWFEGKRVLRAELQTAFARRPVHSLSEMDGNLAGKQDRVAARSNYVEALGLIEFLIQQRGDAAVACLVQDLGREATVEEALRRETGYSPAGLLADWRAWAGLKAAPKGAPGKAGDGSVGSRF